MSKRAAEEQITKDGGFSSEDGVNASTERTATPDVLAKRKIIQPRGRGFQFSNKSASVPGTIFSSSNTSNVESERLKALANKFLRSVQQSVETNAVPDLRPLVEKYLKYYKEIEGSDKAVGTSVTDKRNGDEISLDIGKANAVPSFSKSSNGSTDVGRSKTNSESDSDDEPKVAVQVQGPKFQLSTIPTTKRSAFTFGAPKQSKKAASSDSESDIEVKGPSFTFNKEIKDSTFKLSGGSSDKQGTVDVCSINQHGASGFGPASAATPETRLRSVEEPEITRIENGNDSNKEDNDSAVAGETETGRSSNIIVDEAEGEKLVFAVKAKLMLLKTDDSANPYQTLGVGELKVLESKDGASSRVIIRAEGGLRLLLNAHLIKDVNYTVMGNGSFVRLPALNDSHSIVTYVLKVGSADKGKKLSDALNKSKDAN